MLRALPLDFREVYPALFKLAHQPQESNDFLIFINSINFPTADIGNFSKLLSGNPLDFLPITVYNIHKELRA
jgi:hypothetical protein